MEALPLRRCEFWCPLRYSNWEILGNFIWSRNSCWGQLSTCKIWPFVPKCGGQPGGRWEFASYVLRVSFILLWYHTFFSKNPFRSSEVLVSKLYVWECSTTVGWKTGVLTLCSPAHGVGVSKEDSRTEDWTLNLTGLVWVDFHKWHQIELIVIKNLSNGGNW